MFNLQFTSEAISNLHELEANKALIKRLKAVRKALCYLEINPRHPSLNTHEFTSLSIEYGQKIFEAYAENNTSSVYRIFWTYGPKKNYITIIAITPHP